MAFDKGDKFAIDKAGGSPCPNLARHQCRIHESLDKEGFSGCVAYHCTGAGQRVLTLFKGQSWQDFPALLAPQIETFRHLRKLHGALELLTAAAALQLPQPLEARRHKLLDALSPEDLTPQTAAFLATGPLPGEASSFIRSLAAYAGKTDA